MVLAEPTMEWLGNYASGYLSGLEAVNVAAAIRQRQAFEDFERWLRHTYDAEGAPWYAIIRVYWGACTGGLEKFIELWDEHRREAGAVKGSS